MWVIYAFGSAFFAGMTSILVKCGLKKTNSTVATAIRTIIVLIMSFFMVLIVGSQKDIATVSARNWVFLVLSGIATGASWLCYFRAIQLGDVNKVAPIDKSSTILTILLAFIVLKEPVSWLQSVCVCMIAAGTFMMIEKKDVGIVTNTSKAWLPYAAASAVFAALTSILGKVGISGVESNLGTMIRTIVVLFMSWLTVFATGKGKEVRGIPKGEMAYICVSGIATGASWLLFYKALQEGLASVVVPIDKLSILVTVAFSYFVFGEKLSVKAFFGLVLIVSGTLLMLVKV